MIRRRRPNTVKRTLTMEIKNFKGGVNRLLDEARVAPNEAVTAQNLIQVQDGLWQPRWGTAYYGEALPFDCDGASEYVKSDGTTEIIAVAGGHVWASADAGSWTEIELGAASASPSRSPSASPSRSPSVSPSASPSETPSASPSVSPSVSPSESPTASPSRSPSISPSASPSRSPSASPSRSPSASPSVSPSYGAPIMTEGYQCYFMQIAGYLYIANGQDALVRYDGNCLSTYTALAAPANLAASLVASGLSSGVYTYYAEVTALNDVGETVGSTEASITTNKLRDDWTVTTDKVDWYWDAVSGANRYQLYLGSESGDNFALTSTTATHFVDDGSLTINEFVEPPLSNTTTAPKFKSMTVSGNRIWATNDPDNKYTVYFSGTGAFLGNFSDFYGGGWINLERGGREMPTCVKHYQTGQGAGIPTVLARTPEGRGAIWQIEISTATVGDTSFSVPSASKVVGSFGTNSILGVVQTTNDILFPNIRGVYSLGPEKNYYGILRTNELSTRIRTYWQSLVRSAMGDVCGYFYNSKVLLSVPTAGETNNRIIVYDLERVNWMVDWTVGAKQFFEYTDTSGNNHLMIVPEGGKTLIEMSEDLDGDLGVAFSTEYKSGRMPISKMWKDFVKVNKVYVKLGNQTGTVRFEIAGTPKNKDFYTIVSKYISAPASSSMTGMGYDLMGDVEMGDTDGSPSVYLSDTSSPYYVKVRKKLRDIQLRVYTNGYDDDYILQGFIIEGKQISTNPPSRWKVS